MNKTKELGLSSLCCCNMAIDQENAWFFNLPYAAIFKIDLRKREVHLIRFLDDNKRKMFFDYSYCYIWGERIFMVPNNSKRGICTYDIISDKITYIPFGKDSLINSFFYMSLQVGKNIYMLGRSSRASATSIIEFNMENNVVNELHLLNETLDKMFKGYKFWMEVYMEEDNIFIPCFDKNVILKCNIKNESVTELKINTSIKGIFTLCKFDNRYYISTVNGDLYSADNIHNMEWVFFEHIEGGFIRSIAIDTILYFFPKESECIYYLKSGEYILKKILNSRIPAKAIPNQVLKCCNYYYGTSKTVAVTPWENKSILALMWDGNLYCIKDGACTKLFELKYKSDQDFYQLMAANDKKNPIFEEFGNAYLPIGLDVLKSYNLELFIYELDWMIGHKRNSNNMTFGNRIYWKIIN